MTFGSDLADLRRRVETARVNPAARETPLVAAPKLSARLGATVLVKREDAGPIFSFKLRGASARLAALAPEERERGVVAASAGNHAQGVAYAARGLGIAATIVMPVTTPSIKVDAVRALGARVVLEGDTFADASAVAARLSRDAGLIPIPPYDDPDVIAGDGTVAAEILAQIVPDAIFVPVGGGGLLAGIAGYAAAVAPSVRVIGVEPADAASMGASLRAGEPVTLQEVGLFADGVAVARPGDHPFAIAARHVAGMLEVSNDLICAAIRDLFDDLRVVAEPAGAVALAGLLAHAAGSDVTGQTIVVVLSGSNLNFDRLRFIAERAQIGEARETLLGVTIPERRGAFRAFCTSLGRRSITEFNYRLSGRNEAHVFVGVGTADAADGTAFAASLRESGYGVEEFADNELAKLHIRHMVGGRTGETHDERIFRFVFPERPGALMTFLDRLAGRWNISLFHYRNHGADVGRVLAGFEVPDTELADFERFLDEVGYPAEPESGNAAYRLFLGS